MLLLKGLKLRKYDEMQFKPQRVNPRPFFLATPLLMTAQFENRSSKFIMPVFAVNETKSN